MREPIAAIRSFVSACARRRAGASFLRDVASTVVVALALLGVAWMLGSGLIGPPTGLRWSAMGWFVASAVGLVGLVSSVVRFRRTARDVHGAARRLDAEMGLQERLSTALEAAERVGAGRHQDDDRQEVVLRALIADAAASIGTSDPRAVTPLPLARHLLRIGVAAAIVVPMVLGSPMEGTSVTEASAPPATARGDDGVEDRVATAVRVEQVALALAEDAERVGDAYLRALADELERLGRDYAEGAQHDAQLDARLGRLMGHVARAYERVPRSSSDLAAALADRPDDPPNSPASPRGSTVDPSLDADASTRSGPTDPDSASARLAAGDSRGALEDLVERLERQRSTADAEQDRNAGASGSTGYVFEIDQGDHIIVDHEAYDPELAAQQERLRRRQMASMQERRGAVSAGASQDAGAGGGGEAGKGSRALAGDGGASDLADLPTDVENVELPGRRDEPGPTVNVEAPSQAAVVARGSGSPKGMAGRWPERRESSRSEAVSILHRDVVARYFSPPVQPP